MRCKSTAARRPDTRAARYPLGYAVERGHLAFPAICHNACVCDERFSGPVVVRLMPGALDSRTRAQIEKYLAEPSG